MNSSHLIACLQSLYFREMRWRRDDIAEPISTTCTWLLQHHTFLDWSQQTYGLLWIKGKPGAGKSTLVKHALTVAEQMNEHKTIIISFFFHGRGGSLQKTPLGLWRSLMHQLFTELPHMLTEFLALFNERCASQGPYGDKWEWRESELREHFKRTLRTIARSHKIQMYIDALDECGEESATELMNFFERITSQPGSKTSCLLSSRVYPILVAHSSYEICIDDQNEKDIQTYVQNIIGARIGNRDSGASIQNAIIQKASGTFQWVALVCSKVLVSRKRGKPMKEIEKSVQRMPPDLEDLYESLLQSLDQEDKPLMLRLMQWILFAVRPLSALELREAMILSPHSPYTSLRECQNAQEYADDDSIETRTCDLSRGLAEIKVVDNKRVVQLVHQSVKEFMLDRGFHLLDDTLTASDIPSHAHFWLSRSCLSYLAMNDLRVAGAQFTEEMKTRSPHKVRSLVTEVTREFPLAMYAVSSWVDHVVEVERERSQHFPQGDLLPLFLHQTGTFETWARLDKGLNHWHMWLSDEHVSFPTALHIVAHHGLASVMTALLKHAEGSIDFWCHDLSTCSPLCLAASNGHAAIVKAMLDRGGIQTGFRDGMNHNALHKAIIRKHAATASLLIGYGGSIDLDSRDRWRRTPLHHAADTGLENIVRLLLEPSIQLLTSNNGSSATRQELRKVLKAQINAEDVYGQSPYFLAARRKYWSIAQLMRHFGGDTNLRDNTGCSALGWRLLRGQVSDEEIMVMGNSNTVKIEWTSHIPIYLTPSRKELLKQNVQINFIDGFGETALFTAVAAQEENVVKDLLELGADPRLGQPN